MPETPLPIRRVPTAPGRKRDPGAAVVRAGSGIVAALAVTACAAGVEAAGDTAPRIGIDAVVEMELERTGAPGAVVAVVRGDTLGFLKAYGHVGPKSTEPLNVGARFKAGAVMPVVNALAAASLAADGAVELEAPVGDLVPELPRDLRGVTLAQLLSHTGGLAARPAVPGRADGAEITSAATQLTPLDRLTDPGAVYSYSAAGTALAALVMQRAAGRPYTTLIRETVLQPLGMARSTLEFPGPDAVTPGFASMVAESPMVPAAMTADSTLVVPVRGLWSTAPDLAHLMRALLNDGLVAGERRLDDGVVAEALRPRGGAPGLDAGAITLGPVVDRWEGREHVAVYGTGSGHAMIMRLLPEERIGVVVLANFAAGLLGRVPEFALRALLGLEYPPRRRAAARAATGERLGPTELAGVCLNGSEMLELQATADGLKAKSGDLALDVVWRGGRYHVLIPDGRVALVFDVFRDERGRVFVDLGDRVLACEPPGENPPDR